MLYVLDMVGEYLPGSEAAHLDAQWAREADAARQAALQAEGERLLDALVREDQRQAKAARQASEGGD
jgi:hypothetical protein